MQNRTRIVGTRQNSADRVLDVALRYGYESPEAFARTFLAVCGATPSAAREHGTPLKAYPRLSLQITVQGVTRMNYRIVNREVFAVYGIGRMFDMKDDQNLTDIPLFWKECTQNDTAKAGKPPLWPCRWYGYYIPALR